MPQAARRFGQPRPISRLGHAGRPNKPYLPTIIGASGGGDGKKTVLVEVIGTFFLSLALFKGFDTVLLALGCGLMLALGVWFGGGAYNPTVSVACTGSSILGKAAWSKCPLWQCPSSAPVPPQGAPGSSGQLGLSRKRQAHWAPNHCPGCSS